MITLTLLALLLGASVPALQGWAANTRVRQSGEALQLGARMAQSQAIKRFRSVVWFRTSGCGVGASASATGAFWALKSLPLAGDSELQLHCAPLSDAAQGVSVNGPGALCFNAAGRLIALADPGLGGTACELGETGLQTHQISAAGANRPLQVHISLGGSVRLCDPAKTQSANAPDGCPA